VRPQQEKPLVLEVPQGPVLPVQVSLVRERFAHAQHRLRRHLPEGRCRPGARAFVWRASDSWGPSSFLCWG